MDLRVTPQTLVNNALFRVDQETAQLAKLQEQAATGKKLIVPSDSPNDIGALLANKAQDQRLDTYLSTIAGSRATLNQSVSSLQEANNILTQARTIAVEGGQSTNTPEALGSLAQEVDALLQRLVDVANTQQGGDYLFAGAASKTQPFVITARNADGTPAGIAYQGGTQQASVPVGPQHTVATLYSGQAIFQARARGATVFSKNTGAAAGTGADSATGQGTLRVQHTTTTYAAGAGVQAGAGSAAGDNIIGPAGAHQLTVIDTSGTGAGGTISLDGGPAIAFTSADANLQVSGPNGEIVYVDASAITPNFNGTVNITANGTLSVDGGASSVPIDFTGNQIVANSVTGAVTNVDSSNIRRAGADTVQYGGTYDAFQILMALRDDLRNTQGLPPDQQLASISQRLGELDRVRGNVLAAVGAQATDLKSLDDLESHVKDVQLTTQTLISSLEDADISQVAIQLQTHQNLFSMLLAATARLNQSLIDYLPIQ